MFVLCWTLVLWLPSTIDTFCGGGSCVENPILSVGHSWLFESWKIKEGSKLICNGVFILFLSLLVGMYLKASFDLVLSISTDIGRGLFTG